MFGVSKIELPQPPQFEYRVFDPAVAARLIALELHDKSATYDTAKTEEIVLDTLQKIIGESTKNAKENVKNVSDEE